MKVSLGCCTALFAGSEPGHVAGCVSGARVAPPILLKPETAARWAALERFAAQVVHWHHAPMNAYSEDLRKKIVQALRRGTTKSEAARSFGVSRSSVKRYAKLAEEGRPLAPKRRPGSRPKMDESARRLLEADMEERPAATLSERCEYLGRMASLSLSESTVSRMLRRLGWSRKKDRWER